MTRGWELLIQKRLVDVLIKIIQQGVTEDVSREINTAIDYSGLKNETNKGS